MPGCTYDTKLVKKRKWERFSFFLPFQMQNIQKNEEEKKVKKIFGGRTTTDVVCAAQANMMILFEEKTVRIIQFAKVFFLVQITEYIPIVSSFSLNVKHN